MNRLTDIRLHAQQLVAPQFDDPAELIRWMGMVQAQEYSSAKWAVALRLRTPAAAPVEEALREGRILRMHIMRPTWHFIAAEDVRWMLHLSARRIRAANASFAKGNGCGLDEGDYLRCSRLLERILGGGNHLTRQQIAGELERAGMAVDAPRLNRLMMHAETDGVVCSGADRAGKPTYALLAERVPQAVDLPEEEALALLALRYFRSHSPATFDDFVWWSGLPVGQARRCRGAGRGVAARIVRRAGVSAVRELGDLPKGAGARAPVAGVRRVPDRLQGSFGRAGTGASCAGIQRLRCFPAGAAARRPDRGAVGPQGNAGRRGAVRR